MVINEIILKIEASLMVQCLPSTVGKQVSSPCLHAQIPDVSYLCVMSGSRTLNGDDDDDDECRLHYGLQNPCILLGFSVYMVWVI